MMDINFLWFGGALYWKEEAFQRRPSEDEVLLGKREGMRRLFEIVRNRYQIKVRETDDALTSTIAQGRGKQKRLEDERSSESDEDSARTSSDEEDEEVSYKETADSTSSGSAESSEGDSDRSDGEPEGNNLHLEDTEDEYVEEDDAHSSEATTNDHTEWQPYVFQLV